MMIDEAQATESIIINYFNGSDAVIIIDNQLNNGENNVLRFPTINTKFLDLSQLITPPETPNELTSTIVHTAQSVQEATDEEELWEESSEVVQEVDEADEDSEPELTNLNWLTELKNITNLTPPDQPVPDQPTNRFNKFITAVQKSQESYEAKRFFYETEPIEKPPFNYAHMIAMALLDQGRMTLQQICKWIQSKFAYYKAHKNWNNSIRHNLSLNFFFTKVARNKNEKGKGGYWELAMDSTKTSRKRARQRNRHRNSSNPIANKPSMDQQVPVATTTTTTITTDDAVSTEELLQSIASISSEESTSLTTATSCCSMEGEIYFADEIPQCTNDDIVVPFLTASEITAVAAATTISSTPNVIVEPVNCYLPTMDTFDENELNGLIDLNEQELIDRFLNCSDESGEMFVN